MKKVIGILLTAAIFFFSVLPIYAQEPNVIVKEEVNDIPDYLIQEIINRHPNSGIITILEYGDSSQEQPSKSRGYTGYFDIKKTTTASNVVARDDFLFSVAKGESISSDYTYEGSLESSASGYLSGVALGLKASVKVKYFSTKADAGPAEESCYNSRYFGIMYMENKGTYTAKHHIGATGMGWESVSGDWTEPTKYVAYSIDELV